MKLRRKSDLWKLHLWLAQDAQIRAIQQEADAPSRLVDSFGPLPTWRNHA